MKRLRAGYTAITLAGLLIDVSGAIAQSDPGGVYRVNDTRGPIRSVDLSPFKGEVSSEILAGPTNGLGVAYLIYTRMAPGAR